MTPEERAKKIVGKLCTWIRPSDEEYVIAQIYEAMSQEREACVKVVEYFTFDAEALMVKRTPTMRLLAEQFAETISHTSASIAAAIRTRGNQ